MRFTIQGVFGSVPVAIHRVDWDSPIFLQMSRHTDKAHVFDTAKGDNIAELCRIASEYGFQFYPVAVEPELDIDEFQQRLKLAEQEIVKSFGHLMDRYLGSFNMEEEISMAFLRALENVPAFHNQDVVNDYGVEVARIISRRVSMAMRGNLTREA